MITIKARNVNYALHDGAQLIREVGVPSPSRNGPVLTMPEPVTTVYEKPYERVMLHPNRDANPFFHLYEALWMLAGREDLAPLKPYVARMADYSDDGGKTQPGAYGFRWRHYFGLDQIDWAIKRLNNDPGDRRVVIQMWDGSGDPTAADGGSRDVPCNLTVLPRIVAGRLDITVFCRSNDMVWGTYGANAVHFSFLQEYLAGALGVPMGRYYQVANNFHAYEATLDKADGVWPWDFMTGDPYAQELIGSFALGVAPNRVAEFNVDLAMFLEDPARVGIRNVFLKRVALPMVMAHKAWKRDKDLNRALEILSQAPSWCDWRVGGEMWLKARDAARRRASDDGVNYEPA